MLTIRNFEPSDKEYEEVVRVINLERPDEPQTVRNLKSSDDTWNKEYFRQRFVAELDGKMIVQGEYMAPFWVPEPGVFNISWSLDPTHTDYQENGQSINQLIFEYILDNLAAQNPKLLDTRTREDNEHRIQFLTANGFELQPRDPILSVLDVDSFDFAPYAGLPEKVAQKGIEIHTLAELMQNDPNWLNKIYELRWDIVQDVPDSDPEPLTKKPLEEWKKCLKWPNFLDKGWFVAVDTNIDESSYKDADGRGNYVGVSMLLTNEARPEVMSTWLTGVVRTHRRQGIATAMKLRAFELAQSLGAKQISTGNEENSPMYDLNMQFGFKPQPVWLSYQKTLE